MKENMKNGKTLIDKVMKVIEDTRKKYPQITDDMLYGRGAIYYMNGNDGTFFDWTVNDRCCEFFVFYRSTELGFIKLFVNSNAYHDRLCVSG